LHWAEHGGPPVSQPVRRGFGRVLLEQNFAYDVDGQVTLEFKPAGVLCTAVIPIEQIVEEEA
jgi:two-component sensor histidine kinase